MSVTFPTSSVCFDQLSSAQIIQGKEIERFCFEDPWSEDLWMHYLPQTFALFESDQLLAYAQCSIVLEEAELLRIAVAPSVRRRGIGKQMMSELLCRLQQQGVERMMLEVRESNAAAIALYTTSGLMLEGRRKHYYVIEQTGQYEDALLMGINF